MLLPFNLQSLVRSLALLVLLAPLTSFAETPRLNATVRGMHGIGPDFGILQTECIDSYVGKITPRQQKKTGSKECQKGIPFIFTLSSSCSTSWNQYGASVIAKVVSAENTRYVEIDWNTDYSKAGLKTAIAEDKLMLDLMMCDARKVSDISQSEIKSCSVDYSFETSASDVKNIVDQAVESTLAQEGIAYDPRAAKFHLDFALDIKSGSVFSFLSTSPIAFGEDSRELRRAPFHNSVVRDPSTGKLTSASVADLRNKTVERVKSFAVTIKAQGRDSGRACAPTN